MDSLFAGFALVYYLVFYQLVARALCTHDCRVESRIMTLFLCLIIAEVLWRLLPLLIVAAACQLPGGLSSTQLKQLWERYLS